MKNTYSNVTFSIISATFVIAGFTNVSYAASFEPTSLTYYPPGNTQAINIVNNNYNTNVNTNTVPQTPVAYTRSTNTYNGIDVHNVAKNNLPTLTVAPKDPECTTCSHTSYRLVNQLNCGATVAIAHTNVAKPICSLVPALTASGAIELQWRTAGATVAFIDGGIGHVTTVSGKRIVTPSKDTAYNLTVLNDAGIAGTCGARVNISMGQGSTVNVVATNTNYTYSLNGGTQSTSVSTSTSSGQTTGTSQSTTDVNDSTNTTIDEVGDASESTSLFGSGFKKVAIPVGIVFLILIVLLVFIMSKVKGVR